MATNSSVIPNEDKNFKDIICDLLLSIENLIAGNSTISQSVNGRSIGHKIISHPCHPTIAVLYTNRTISNKNENLKEVICDLLLSIEYLCTNTSNILRNNNGKFIEYVLNPLPNQPVVAVLYENCTIQRVTTVYGNECELRKKDDLDTKTLAYYTKLPNATNEAYIVSSNFNASTFAEMHKNNKYSRQESETSDYMYNIIANKYTLINSEIIHENTSAGIDNSLSILDGRNMLETDNLGSLLNERLTYGFRESLEETQSSILFNKVNGTAEEEECSYSCALCRKSYKRRWNNRTHERMLSKSFICESCKKSFSGLEYINSHEPLSSSSIPSTEDCKPIMKRLHFCSFCDKAFRHSGHKNRHERSHILQSKFLCSFCEKPCRCLSEKKAHERTHTGKRGFRRNLLIQVSKLRDINKTEGNLITSESRPFACDFCEKTFKYKKDKLDHEITHIDPRPFKCDFCEKSFTRIGSKRIHERSHTGERPYKCTYCDRRFSDRTCIKRHERTHTGIKPYKCDLCDKHFTRLSIKKKHERNMHREEFPCTSEDGIITSS